MIDGAVNFRDLGGLPTMDGRTVRAGLLFRCGTLHAVSDAGLADMETLGLRVLFDLRSNEERKARPPRLSPTNGPRMAFRAHDRKIGQIFRDPALPGAAPDAAAEHMRRAYRELPYAFGESYRMLFGELLDTSVPLAFGCAAGKDRTGVAAMLILTALGVPRHEIEADYRRTEQHFDTLVAMFRSGPSGQAFRGIDQAAWEPVLRSDPTYLDSAYDAIAARNGSVEAYLADEMGIGDEETGRLRDILLL